MKRNEFPYLFFLLAGLVFLSSGVGVSFAGLKVEPRLSLSEEYNDNIYLDPSGEEEDDWITTVEPGIKLIYDGSRLNADIDYSLRFRDYRDHSDEDETRFSDIQRLSSRATLFPRNNFQILAQGDISRVIVDESERNSEENEFVNRATLFHFSINPKYVWRPVSTLQTVVGYKYEQATYSQIEGSDYLPGDEPTDWFEHSANLDISKQFGSRTGVSLGYRFTDHHYKDSNNNEDEEDFRRHDILAGIQRRFGKRITLNLGGGLVYFDFDDSGSYNGYSWLTELNWEISHSLDLAFDYTRDYTVSVSRGLSRSQEATLLIDYHRRLSMSIETFARRSRYSEDGDEFKPDSDNQDQSVGARFNLSYPLSKRLSFILNSDYAYEEYDPDDEDVDVYGLGTALQYDLKHLSFNLSYKWRDYNSNFNENDYRNNIVLFTITWALRK